MRKSKNISMRFQKSVSAGVAIGVVVAIGACIILSALLTSFVLGGKIAEQNCSVYMFAIRAIGILLGSLVGVKIAEKKYLPVIGMIAGSYMLVLLAMGIVFFGGTFENFGIGMLSVILGSGIACLIKMKPPKKKNHGLHYSK